MDDAKAYWGIAYHTNSHSPRSKKWYRVSRLIKADGRWFELYWGDAKYRGGNLKAVRDLALHDGLALLHGVFTNPPMPHVRGEMIWSINK